MLTFKQFTLLEASIKDIVQGHVNNGHDASHVKNIIKLAQEANKSGGARIDITQNFNKIENAVNAHINKNAKRNAIVPVHTSKNLMVNRIDTEEACVRNYGGGKTKWCVAAKKNDPEGNAFKEYRDVRDGTGVKNNMFAIHTPSGVYAYHEGEGGIMRDSKNNVVDILDFAEENPGVKNVKALTDSKHGVLFQDKNKQREFMKKSQLNDDISDTIAHQIINRHEDIANEFKDHPNLDIRSDASKWKSVADKYMNPEKGEIAEKSPYVLAAVANHHIEHARVLQKHPDPDVRAGASMHPEIAKSLLDNGERDSHVRSVIRSVHRELYNTHPNGREADMRK